MAGEQEGTCGPPLGRLAAYGYATFYTGLDAVAGIAACTVEHASGGVSPLTGRLFEVGGDAPAHLAHHQRGWPSEETPGRVDVHPGAVLERLELVADGHRERPVDLQLDEPVGFAPSVAGR